MPGLAPRELGCEGSASAPAVDKPVPAEFVHRLDRRDARDLVASDDGLLGWQRDALGEFAVAEAFLQGVVDCDPFGLLFHTTQSIPKSAAFRRLAWEEI